MCVLTSKRFGRGKENLCLSIGIVRDASPDSITDIKIRKADQIPLGKVHFGEEGGSWQRLGVGGGGFGR